MLILYCLFGAPVQEISCQIYSDQVRVKRFPSKRNVYQILLAMLDALHLFRSYWKRIYIVIKIDVSIVLKKRWTQFISIYINDIQPEFLAKIALLLLQMVPSLLFCRPNFHHYANHYYISLVTTTSLDNLVEKMWSSMPPCSYLQYDIYIPIKCPSNGIDACTICTHQRHNTIYRQYISIMVLLLLFSIPSRNDVVILCMRLSCLWEVRVKSNHQSRYCTA